MKKTQNKIKLYQERASVIEIITKTLFRVGTVKLRKRFKIIRSNPDFLQINIDFFYRLVKLKISIIQFNNVINL